MPPKTQAPLPSGQKNLFSFFNKAATTAATTTPAAKTSQDAPAKLGSSAKTPSTITSINSMSTDKSLKTPNMHKSSASDEVMVVEVSDATSNKAPAASTSTSSDNASSGKAKRGRVVLDDDDEDGDNNDNNKNDKECPSSQSSFKMSTPADEDAGVADAAVKTKKTKLVRNNNNNNNNNNQKKKPTVNKSSKTKKAAASLSDEELWDSEESEDDASESSDDASDASLDDESDSDDDDSDEDEEEEDEEEEDSDDDDVPAKSRKRGRTTKKQVKAPPAKKAVPVKTPASTKSLSSHTSATKTPASHTITFESTPPTVSTPFSAANLSSSSSSSPPAIPESNTPLPDGVNGLGCHEHDTWEWLKPSHRRDKNMRRPTDPDYNPRTLYVPDHVLKDATPAMEQWWKFKSENMDTVLFFKVGKFYELFHMDSDIGMKELDLIYMKGEKGHSGFPEISYGKFASALVSKGYRVARVEQTETPEMLKDRNAETKGKKDKVVRREMCSVMSKGTRTYCHMDDLSLLDENVSQSQSDSVLMCIKEGTWNNNEGTEMEGGAEGQSGWQHGPSYGICVIDTVIGNVTLAQFDDDLQRSRLRTLVSRYTPSEVLLHATECSPETLGVFKLLVPKAVFEYLSRTEFPSATQTLKLLDEGRYYGDDRNEWPEILQAVVAGIANDSSALLACAIGGCVWQLKRSLIDYEVLSMKKLSPYIPPDENVEGVESGAVIFGSSANAMDVDDATASATSSSSTASDDPSSKAEGPLKMTLDAVALQNLEVLVNNFDKTEKGSLWAFVNRSKTPFGRRMLKEWLCNPLFRPQDIKARAQAIELLLTDFNEEAEQSRNVMKSLPDLERLLLRIHSNSIRKKGPPPKSGGGGGMGAASNAKSSALAAHPDTRAIMYENPIYNKRKIQDFADLLNGFEKVLKLASIWAGKEGVKESRLLCRVVVAAAATKSDSDTNSASGGRFPSTEMANLLKHFRSVFDEKQAKAEGIINPRPGVNPDYDKAKEMVADISERLEAYLREQKKVTGISDLKYWGNGKDRYQIEVAMNLCGKVPRSWTTKSQKKTHRRYRTPEIEDMLSALQEAEANLLDSQNDTLRKIFERFDDNRRVWQDALSCCATLDCLCALASVSSGANYNWPVILSRSSTQGPLLDIQAGRHPMLEDSMIKRGEGDYIPNTVVLGNNNNNNASDSSSYNGRLLLLSGPNMGGKSTLLRQTCLIALLAQLGCKVPADAVTMTPIDRIFTRVGASDRILAGQSTFFVELAETAVMLRQATEDSLGILDELGRGTATFDGTAIAHACVEHIVRVTRCRTLFATHYHSLIDDWNMDPRVQLGHMQCLVQGADDVSTSETSTTTTTTTTNANTTTSKAEKIEEVMFLYHLTPGSSPRSYGINVARLAKLPSEVISLALAQSREFEVKMKLTEAAKEAAVSEGEGGGGGGGGGGGNSRKRFQAFFDRLVSVSHADMPLDELVVVAAEIWKRFHQGG